MIFATGATSQSIDIAISDDAGLPVTGLVAATFPPVKYSVAGPNADVTITPVDLAAIGTAWTSSGVKERGEGVYRLDLPNAALAAPGRVRIRAEATNKRLLCEAIEVFGTESAMAPVITPSNPGYTTGYLLCLSTAGVVESGVSVRLRGIAFPAASGVAVDGRVRTGTSNGSGVVEFSNMVLGGTYMIRRGASSPEHQVTISSSAGATCALPSLVGGD